MDLRFVNWEPQSERFICSSGTPQTNADCIFCLGGGVGNLWKQGCPVVNTQTFPQTPTGPAKERAPPFLMAVIPLMGK